MRTKKKLTPGEIFVKKYGEKLSRQLCLRRDVQYCLDNPEILITNLRWGTFGWQDVVMKEVYKFLNIIYYSLCPECQKTGGLEMVAQYLELLPSEKLKESKLAKQRLLDEADKIIHSQDQKHE